MIKWISSILIILLGIVISIILYLSTVGIETKSLNNLIEKNIFNNNYFNNLSDYFINFVVCGYTFAFKINFRKYKVEFKN